MRVLDCSSLSTTYASLESLLEMDRAQIREKLRHYSVEDFLARDQVRPGTPLPDLVLDYVTAGAPTWSPDFVTWFHATRVLPSTSFSEGLLPLPQRVEPTRALLQSLIPSCLGNGFKPSSDWSNGRDQGGKAHGLKMGLHRDWGPDAFLVRDAIFRRDPLFHDYLNLPELVEDLAGILVGDRRPELLECFRAVTRPCIVTFRSHKPRPDTVRPALYYAYSAEWRLEFGIEANTCYSGDGDAISAEDILDVEFLRDSA